MPCPACLDHAASTRNRRRSSSLPPPRSRGRRSHSRTLKRHGRTLPSAVRRRRLQAPQKGELIGAMKPTRPRSPSAKRKVVAVAEGSAVGSATSGCAASIRRRVSDADTQWSDRQVRPESSGIHSMKRTSMARRRASSAKATASSSLRSRSRTTLTFTGPRSSRMQCSMQERTSASGVRLRVSLAKRSGSSVSRLTVTRSIPCRRQSATVAASPLAPLVVSANSHPVASRRPRAIEPRSGCRVGSPPVRRIRRMPSEAATLPRRTNSPARSSVDGSANRTSGSMQ